MVGGSILTPQAKINTKIASGSAQLSQTLLMNSGDVVSCPIPPKNQHASGYAWRGVSLTRQDLICLLIFVQRMNNRNTALVLGVASGTVHKRSARLRHRLGFENKRAMVLATQQAGFLTIFPSDLIDSLFDELDQRKKSNKFTVKNKKL